MHALYLDEHGHEAPIFMGCYGIGVARTIAAAIEQNHDENGIVFPLPIAPFEGVILPLQMHQTAVVEAAERIYSELLGLKIDVLLDDRDVRPGVKFKDADLLGTPLRITLSEKNLKEGKAELKVRSEREASYIPLDQAPAIIMETIKEHYDSIK